MYAVVNEMKQLPDAVQAAEVPPRVIVTTLLPAAKSKRAVTESFVPEFCVAPHNITVLRAAGNGNVNVLDVALLTTVVIVNVTTHNLPTSE